jgi:hypothetical protein
MRRSDTSPRRGIDTRRATRTSRDHRVGQSATAAWKALHSGSRSHSVCIDRRLQVLLDKQDRGQPLTEDEGLEAEGLVELADLLSLLRLRASGQSDPPG